MPKITMQDIADELNVSRVSVWKVFNDYPGVSEALKQQVVSAARKMGYFKNNKYIQADEQAADTESEEHVTISVVVSRPESSLFWMEIIHMIAKELTDHDISLIYTYVPPHHTEGYKLPVSLTNGMVQGIIIMNLYDQALLSMLNDLKLPKVFLDIVTAFPQDKLTGDLVLLEGRNIVKTITEDIIKKGRRDIGFIGATDYAKTNQDRYEGYLTALMLNQITPNPAICLTGNIGIHTYKEEITNFLDNLEHMPEAFVCVSDFVANFLIQYLGDKHLQVPEDVAVSGYDGSTEYGDLANHITSVQVDTNALGKRLVKQLLYRINDPDTPNETIYISFDIFYGDTTDF